MKVSVITSIFCLIFKGTIGAAIAQEPSPTTPPPPCQSEIYHQFDFWIGHWDVFDQNGNKLGENLITSEENGCLIVEKWTSSGGSTGQSYNYVDAQTLSDEKALWRQVWVSQGFTINYTGGLNDVGAMVLEGSLAGRNGRTFPFRGTWTKQEDASVKQFFEQYNAETQSWAPWFLGIYRLKQETEE